MTKLIDTREIAAFAQINLPEWMEVPGWVRYVAVDQDGDITGFERRPLNSHSFWSRHFGQLRKPHSIHHQPHPLWLKTIPDWEDWYWEVPA